MVVLFSSVLRISTSSPIFDLTEQWNMAVYTVYILSTCLYGLTKTHKEDKTN